MTFRVNGSFLAKLQSCKSEKVGNQKWCSFFDLMYFIQFSFAIQANFEWGVFVSLDNKHK